MAGIKEQKFLQELENIFVGAKIEGKSGYVNLMNIKSKYFQDIKAVLLKDIEKRLSVFPDFREELFDKLYSFFYRYFTESGSIYFRHTHVHQNVYERIYNDSMDVELFWKTHMLYFVKSEAIYKSIRIELEGLNFYFDASEIELKKSNEKKDIVFTFDGVKGTDKKYALMFKVNYSKNGSKTSFDNILRDIKKLNIGEIDEEVLEKAFSVFTKQSLVDFFINKNAKDFLTEQFDLWVYNYMFKDMNTFTEKRIKQIQVLRDTAYDIINFIAQFEDELVKIWNKPKFVLNSNYVITLNNLEDKIIEKIKQSQGIHEQVNEWIELGLVSDDFHTEDLNKSKYPYLPLDTRYFKELEIEILGCFDDIDEELNGYLVHSENYQALNTLLPKFKNRIRTIYIDPPFNKESDADYFYTVKYKDSTWITILENRLNIAKNFLNKRSSIFVRCDYNGNAYVRLLLDKIFGKQNFKNEILVNRSKKIFTGVQGYNVATDSLFYYTKTDDMLFNPQYKKRDKEQTWINAHSPGERRPPERIFFGKLMYPPKGRHWTFIQSTIDKMIEEGRIKIKEDVKYIDLNGQEVEGMPQYLTSEEELLDSNWTDIPGYSNTQGFQTENSEALLKRVIESSTDSNDFVMDFFLGSATTIATAQKLGRRWIGVEMGDHFYSVCLPRMKKVVAGVKSQISNSVEYQGGGFFKYFDLEQYEDVLRNVSYKDDDLLIFNANKSPYEQYVFMRDEKMTNCVQVDGEDEKVKVDLTKLYHNIDIAETLSCLTGKSVRRISSHEIVFDDGSKQKIDEIDYRLLKQLIWWC